MISGNFSIDISDHLPSFLIVPNKNNIQISKYHNIYTCDFDKPNLFDLNRWLTAFTKIKFVEKYISHMNAGLEKATPSAMPVQPRTRAGLTGRYRAKQGGCMPSLIFVQTNQLI